MHEVRPLILFIVVLLVILGLLASWQYGFAWGLIVPILTVIGSFIGLGVGKILTR